MANPLVDKIRVLGPGERPAEWGAADVEPNAEYERFHLVCKLRPNVVKPYVLCAAGGEGGKRLRDGWQD